MTNIQILKERKKQIYEKGSEPFDMSCDKHSLAGVISQRACVFCGSRVVLYPVADALHLVHGPVGCAVYTWDIRGALSSGPELHRNSFTTDLREKDVIFGGEKKLYRALTELIDANAPKAAFVYSTCIVGIIGDDVERVCKKVSKEKGIPVLPVHSEGFKGTKKDGYKAACTALSRLIGEGETSGIGKYSLNILGEFNIGGEAWIIQDYYKRMGIEVVSVMTGNGRVDEIKRSHGASLNVVQCSGSMIHLAKMMEEKYGIPYMRVSYFGIEDMSEALYNVARHFKDNPEIMERTRRIVRDEIEAIRPQLKEFRHALEGKKAAIYVGGAFKAFSLIKALRHLGMDVVLAGSQTGDEQDYELLRKLCDEGAVIVDDANPLELSKYMVEKKADLFIGGVKERPIAYKMGVGFCDHNHERKTPLAGFVGMVNFAREVHRSVTSPVWKVVRGEMPLVREQAKTPGKIKKPGKGTKSHASTRNACKLCTPLGASLAFKGIAGAVPFLHGSQGCSTYIRRYLISHFKEPVDIACSNFSEHTAVFGGGANLKIGVENIRKQYKPELIGIATTCLSETIGDDVPMFLKEYRESHKEKILPPLVHVSTPSYQGTHADGFRLSVQAVTEQLALEKEKAEPFVNIFPGMVSPADMRHLKEIMEDFHIPYVMLPDYSETLDGALWKEYKKITPGGTRVSDIGKMGSATASIELGSILAHEPSAGKLLKERFGVPLMSTGLPMGVRESDLFFASLESAFGRKTPEKYRAERARLLDSYVDGHKYVSQARAVIYGEEDLVAGLASLLGEIGILPVLCASGGQSGYLEKKIEALFPESKGEINVLNGADFMDIEEAAKDLNPDLFIGNSKGYTACRRLQIPLVRMGFPIHDRFGGSRIPHIAYRGTQSLFDTIVNTIIEKRQSSSSVGYTYI